MPGNMGSSGVQKHPADTTNVYHDDEPGPFCCGYYGPGDHGRPTTQTSGAALPTSGASGGGSACGGGSAGGSGNIPPGGPPYNLPGWFETTTATTTTPTSYSSSSYLLPRVTRPAAAATTTTAATTAMATPMPTVVPHPPPPPATYSRHPISVLIRTAAGLAVSGGLLYLPPEVTPAAGYTDFQLGGGGGIGGGAGFVPAPAPAMMMPAMLGRPVDVSPACFVDPAPPAVVAPGGGAPVWDRVNRRGDANSVVRSYNGSFTSAAAAPTLGVRTPPRPVAAGADFGPVGGELRRRRPRSRDSASPGTDSDDSDDDRREGSDDGEDRGSDTSS